VEQRVFSNDPGFDAMARQQARNMVSYHFKPPFQRAIVVLQPSAAVYEAVVCNDMPSRTDEQYWVEQGRFQATNYPVFGGGVTEQPCIYWGGPTVSKPPLSAASGAAPILMLQSEYDGPTPREGAMAAFEAMPNAGMIYVDSEYSHGLFPYQTACVDQAVADYFVSGSFPGRGQTVTCPGRPLPFDPAPALLKRATRPDEGGQPYLDPALANELIEGIHRTIQGSGSRF
jgi:pimeloyl-ACP methyl ester carboxylesterase